MPVSWLRTVTAAPGSTAPCGSTTRPRTSVVPCCATAAVAISRNTNACANIRLVITLPPSHEQTNRKQPLTCEKPHLQGMKNVYGASPHGRIRLSTAMDRTPRLRGIPRFSRSWTLPRPPTLDDSQAECPVSSQQVTACERLLGTDESRNTAVPRQRRLGEMPTARLLRTQSGRMKKKGTRDLRGS